MTLKELFSHFKEKTVWVNLSSRAWCKSGEMKAIEKELPEHILNMKVNAWNYTNALNINI